MSPTARSLLAGLCGAAALVGAGRSLAAQAVAAKVDPEVTFSLRGVHRGEIEQGEPWHVVVRLEAPSSATAPLELVPDAGNVIACVHVELLRAHDRTVVATARAADPGASPRVVLDSKRIATGRWYFSTASMGGVARGEYLVRARLVVQGRSGWTGSAESPVVAVRIAAVSNDASRVSARAIARAHDSMFTGSKADGVRHLDAVLARDPNDIEVLAMRAALSLRGGNVRAAQILVSRAIGLAARAKLPHPPFELFDLERRILAARPAAAPPPDWTRLPSSVLESPGPPATGADAATRSAPPGAATPRTVVGAPPSGVVVPVAELSEARIRADASGQWVASAKAGSEYGTPNYGAVQLVGPPDVPDGNDNPKAWCHHSSAKGLEWVELTFAKAVHATEVRVRQSYNPGAIVKVEAIDSSGAAHVWWQGVDPARPRGALNAIAWFAVRVPKTDYRVTRVKLTLDLDAVASWQEIDAVQLVGVVD
ncbi:MAG: hypothetical protein KDC87_14295 [Planctomycetes bacterium]|nr:hypothetical protein [Planctomycetota bacterium]MCB9888890.1 hypothetical protein [Planctomycetota bacterium]